MDTNTIDIMEKNENGHNGFYIAILLQHYEICSYILQYNHIFINDLFYYLEIAYMLNYESIFKLLLKYMRFYDIRNIKLPKIYNVTLYYEFSSQSKKILNLEQLKYVLWNYKKKQMIRQLQKYIAVDTINYVFQFLPISHKIINFDSH